MENSWVLFWVFSHLATKEHYVQCSKAREQNLYFLDAVFNTHIKDAYKAHQEVT